MSEQDFFRKLYQTILKAIISAIVSVVLAAGGSIVYVQSRMADHEQRINQAEATIKEKADKEIVIYRLDKIDMQVDRIESKIDELKKQTK